MRKSLGQDRTRADARTRSHQYEWFAFVALDTRMQGSHLRIRKHLIYDLFVARFVSDSGYRGNSFNGK